MRSIIGDNTGRLDVSRETLDRLEMFGSLVIKWNKAINLIAKSSEAEIWQRHIVDSAQLIEFIPKNAQTLCDLGSGGGFPGIVIAVIAREILPDLTVTLVESDKRKAVFLGQAARDLGLSVSVKSCRIEDLPAQNADVISARALSALVELLPFAVRHLKLGGTAIFPKGSSATREIEIARREWAFDLSGKSSRTSEDGRILVLKEIVHV
jgi:16S rRNA (guanine527-N7)-methyltransferase